MIVSGFGLPQPYEDVLSTARDARNYLAHEAGEDFESKFQNKDAWEAWLRTLREKVLEIAVGKQVVSVLLGKLTDGALPTAATLSVYPERIAAWVCADDRG